MSVGNGAALFASALDKLNNSCRGRYTMCEAPGFPADVIGLHFFRNGYCGISRIEDDRFCLCYMTAAENWSSISGNSIPEMEKNISCGKIRFWKRYLATVTPSSDQSWVTISQISFEKKDAGENHILFGRGCGGGMVPLPVREWNEHGAAWKPDRLSLYRRRSLKGEIARYADGTGLYRPVEKAVWQKVVDGAVAATVAGQGERGEFFGTCLKAVAKTGFIFDQTDAALDSRSKPGTC